MQHLKTLGARTRLSLCAAAALLGMAAAPACAGTVGVTYEVELAFDGGFDAPDVMGEIVTDGTLGTLSARNIIDWSLDLSDGYEGVLLVGPGDRRGANSILDVRGSLLSATATGLIFDFDGGNGALSIEQTDDGDAYLCILVNACGKSGKLFYVSVPDLDIDATTAQSGKVTLGTNSDPAPTPPAVPLPGTLPLALLGMAGLGVAAARRKR